jgi:uridine kinase
MTDELSKAVVAIQLKRIGTPLSKAILIGITGIDGCGKGYVTRKIVSELRKQGFKAVGINADDWLNLPDKRFSPTNPAEHFYDNAIRFEDMFDQLVLPLKHARDKPRAAADLIIKNDPRLNGPELAHHLGAINWMS